MTTDEFYARLEAAEKVCVLVGMTGIGFTERDKALTELWMRWNALVPDDFTNRANHLGLTDEAIAELARIRDEKRERVLAALVEVVDEP